MFVYNTCRADARVLKSAATLAATGHKVRIVAVLDPTTDAYERRGEFEILRIARDPLHYRILRRGRAGRRRVRLDRARLGRAARRTRLRAVRLARPRWRRLRRVTSSRWKRLRRRARGPWRRARLRLRRLVRPWWHRLRALVLRAGRFARQRLGLPVPPPRAPREPSAPSTVSAPSPAPAPPADLPQLAPAPVRESAPRRAGGRRLRGTAVPRSLAPLSRIPRRTLMRFHKPFMFTDFYWRSFRLIAQAPADVYHAHDLNTLPVAALLARVTRGRLVYDSHELYTEISTLSPRERAVWRVVERLLIRRADRVITVCESIADELARRYGIEKPTIVLNCPSARQQLEPSGDANILRARAGLASGAEPIVLYQGGFAPNRGLETLIEAMVHVERGVLVMMGWGRLEVGLRHLIRERGLAERVVITGPVPQHALLGYTRGADIGVIPYRAVGLNNYYTTPNKLFEYMGAGIPIACSRFPELVRFVEGLGIGATFDPEDPYDMAATLNRLLADPARLREMRAKVLATGKRFTWEAESVKLLAAYATTSTARPSRV